MIISQNLYGLKRPNADSELMPSLAFGYRFIQWTSFAFIDIFSGLRFHFNPLIISDQIINSSKLVIGEGIARMTFPALRFSPTFFKNAKIKV